MKKQETRIRSLEAKFIAVDKKDVARATLDVYCPATGISATTQRNGKTIAQAVNRCLGWYHGGKWNVEATAVEPATATETISFAELE